MPRIGLLAGGFNPVTRAHVALAEAASPLVDRVMSVVPRTYPHKEFHGATLDERIEMLRRVPSLANIHVSEGGLFLDIARELRRAEPQSEILFICGRDAAERVIGWDYGEPGIAQNMLDEFQLLVASRNGIYRPPEEFAHRIHALALPQSFDEVSSTEIRNRIACGDEWEMLVPPEIADLVRRIYRP